MYWPKNNDNLSSKCDHKDRENVFILCTLCMVKDEFPFSCRKINLKWLQRIQWQPPKIWSHSHKHLMLKSFEILCLKFRGMGFFKFIRLQTINPLHFESSKNARHTGFRQWLMLWVNGWLNVTDVHNTLV